MSNTASRAMLHVAVPRRVESVSRIRHVVVELARDRVAPECLGDLALVTSELLTNALQHGSPESDIVADVSECDDRFVVAVTNGVDEDRPPPVAKWTLAGRRHARGRGLGIVSRLAPDASVSGDDARITITVAWPLGA